MFFLNLIFSEFLYHSKQWTLLKCQVEGLVCFIMVGYPTVSAAYCVVPRLDWFSPFNSLSAYYMRCGSGALQTRGTNLSHDSIAHRTRSAKWNYLGKFRELPWNQTTDVYLARVIT